MPKTTIDRLIGKNAFLPVICDVVWSGKRSTPGGQCLAVWDLKNNNETPIWCEVNWTSKARQQTASLLPLMMSTSPWMWSCLGMDRNGDLLASGGTNGVQVWKAATGQQLHHFRPNHRWASAEKPGIGEFQQLTSSLGGDAQHHNVGYYGVECIQFSPISDTLFCGDDGGRINVADAATGQELGTWLGHIGKVLALAVAPTGQLVASGGEDRTVRLWDVSTGRELAHWEAHDDHLTALAFSPDSGTLVTGSADGTVKLWNLPFIRRELAKLGLDWL